MLRSDFINNNDSNVEKIIYHFTYKHFTIFTMLRLASFDMCFIVFNSYYSTDEDARQAMMNDGGKIKEVQVKLLLSSRSEMHKVIESARQSVSFLQLTQPVTSTMQQSPLPASITGLLAQNIKSLPLNLSPFPIPSMESITMPVENMLSMSEAEKESRRIRDSKGGERKSVRSRSKSRDRDKKDRSRDKKDKRDRSRSRDRSRDRDRRRRDRSRSRERRDRKRDRKDRSRSRDRDRSKDNADPRLQRKDDKKIDAPMIDMDIKNPIMKPQNIFNKTKEGLLGDFPLARPDHPPMMPMTGVRAPFMNPRMNTTNKIGWSADMHVGNTQSILGNPPNTRMYNGENNVRHSRFSDNINADQMHRLQELDERRNPNAFQTSDISGYGPRSQEPRVPYHEYVPNNRPPQQNYVDKNMPNHDMRNRFNNNMPGFCIKVQNLLTSTGYGDIRRFFAGNFISNQGLKIINNENGKRSGTAFVKFFKNDGKINALRKNGELIKGRPVVITHLEEEEFENAIDSYRPTKESEDSGEEGDSQKSLVIVENNDSDEKMDVFKILVLEDLPAFAKEHDIMKMFSDYSLLSIIIIVTKDVRKQYMAYVQFVNADDAKAALNNKSKHLIGHKVIKVSPCSDAVFESVKASQNNVGDNFTKNNVENEDQYPENADLPPISRDPRRRFDNRHDDLGGNYNNKHIKPFHGAQNQGNPRFQWRNNSHNDHVPERDHRPIPRRPMIHNDYNNSFMDSKILNCTFLRGLPLRTEDHDILEFFSDVGVIPLKTHLMLTLQGQPSGDCFCEFMEIEEAATAASKNGSMMGNNVITIELVTKQVVDEARGLSHDKGFGMRGGYRGRGFHPRGGMRRMRGGGSGPYHSGSRGGGNRLTIPSEHMYNQGDNGTGIESFGVPGCVLSLENVPFRAEIDEILHFFRGFNLTQNDVIRRFNEKGHATGDVRVNLHSPLEAERALQQLNKQFIRDRSISITLI